MLKLLQYDVADDDDGNKPDDEALADEKNEENGR